MLSNKISASELSRKFTKSALLVGYVYYSMWYVVIFPLCLSPAEETVCLESPPPESGHNLGDILSHVLPGAADPAASTKPARNEVKRRGGRDHKTFQNNFLGQNRNGEL